WDRLPVRLPRLQTIRAARCWPTSNGPARGALRRRIFPTAARRRVPCSSPAPNGGGKKKLGGGARKRGGAKGRAPGRATRGGVKTNGEGRRPKPHQTRKHKTSHPPIPVT